jgi:hypothetical protein
MFADVWGVGTLFAYVQWHAHKDQRQAEMHRGFEKRPHYQEMVQMSKAISDRIGKRFELADFDRNGFITSAEYRKWIDDHGYQVKLYMHEMSIKMIGIVSHHGLHSEF